MATIEDLAEVSLLLLEVKALLRRCGEEEARVMDEDETEAVVVPDELRDEYRDAVGQLLEMVPDYAALFGLGITAPPSSEGLDRWGPVLDRAGWSGHLLQFKLRMLGRAGRGRVSDWARRRTRAVPRRVLKAFLATLNAALGSLGALPGVDLLREFKEFLEGLIGNGGGDLAGGDQQNGDDSGGATGPQNAADDDHSASASTGQVYHVPPEEHPRGALDDTVT